MIDVRVDSAALESYLANMIAKQLPFAITKALNDTARAAQTAIREGLTQHFTLRRRAWAMQNVKITQFAQKRQVEFVATIAIQAPGDASRSDILSKFEAGGVKRPIGASQGLAVPAEEIKRTGGGLIPANLRPRALQLKFHGTAGGKVQYKGVKGTFAVQRADGSGGILQRQKGGRVVVLYWFQRSVRIKPVLQFRATAERVMTESFPGFMNAALANAIRTAR